MKKIYLLLLFILGISFCSRAQSVSGLSKREFSKYWRIESESPDYRLSFYGDTADIIAPKGLTLWRKQKLSGRKVVIEYDACVVDGC